jgi:hypothetical protein
MQGIHKFKDDLNKGGDPTKAPFRISATALDNNFQRLTPIQQEGPRRKYFVEETDLGWQLKGITGMPAGAKAKQFSVCENGSPISYWFVVWDEEPQL